MPQRRVRATKLDRFLWTNSIKPAHIAREAGCSRQHLYRMRAGSIEPTRPVIRALRIAARKLLQSDVCAEELFDL